MGQFLKLTFLSHYFSNTKILMITIISPPKPTTSVPCPRCGAVIGYSLADVQEDYVTDYTGDRDYYKYIPCPCCTSQIKIK